MSARPIVVDAAPPPPALEPEARAAQLVDGAIRWSLEQYGREPTPEEWWRFNETYALMAKLCRARGKRPRRPR